MPTVSVTRFRARSLWVLMPFSFASNRVVAQVKRAEGFLSGALLPEEGLAFWTMTCWKDPSSMQAFATSGAHRQVMPMMATWACEAGSVTWQQQSDALPDWSEAFRRMRSEGHPIDIPHPGPGHLSLAFSAPSPANAVPLRAISGDGPEGTGARWYLVACLSGFVGLVSLRYLVTLSLAPPNVSGNPYFSPWIVVHAAGAATALMVGPFQFLSGLRSRKPRLHRLMGRIYVVGCLSGGGSGLVLGLAATSGPIAQWGFGALGTFWIASTALGWRFAVKRRIDEHRRWMLRSFALTFGAVMLRIYLPLSQALHMDFLVAYRIISWLAWAPNALLMEIWIRGGRRHD
jgi:uncharacterized membrane protein